MANGDKYLGIKNRALKQINAKKNVTNMLGVKDIGSKLVIRMNADC